ncbi:MAG: hypothetical protein B7Y32_01220 [Methylophilales bacterium 16-45-7]|nr:MAG: hypothetical protein B7Y32_01220 [Methylophilales bacterium 16-45-7]
MALPNNTFFADTLNLAKTPAHVSKYIKVIGFTFFLIPFIALFLPWQQNVTAMGKVTAFAPSERVQSIDAPLNGVISKWYVQEGSKVNKGDPLLEISDIDPMFKERLQAQRDNLRTKLSAKESELQSYELQQRNLVSSRDAKISAAQYKLDVAKQKILSSAETLSATQATVDAAEFQINRLKRLYPVLATPVSECRGNDMF